MYAYDGSTWIKASSAQSLSYALFEYTATAGQTTFSGSSLTSTTLSYTAGMAQVFMNGVLLAASDYTATNGTSVVLASGASAGDAVSILALASFSVANAYTKSEIDALIAVAVSGAGFNPFLLMGV
jgi:hypothetical protein